MPTQHTFPETPIPEILSKYAAPPEVRVRVPNKIEHVKGLRSINHPSDNYQQQTTFRGAHRVTRLREPPKGVGLCSELSRLLLQGSEKFDQWRLLVEKFMRFYFFYFLPTPLHRQQATTASNVSTERFGCPPSRILSLI